MIGLALILGHLIGDYVLQDDWQAHYKKAPHPGPRPPDDASCWGAGVNACDYAKKLRAWETAFDAYQIAWLACTAHCLLYTFSVWAVLLPLSYAGFCPHFPWWFFAGVFALHWPVDRYRLAARFMRSRLGRQEQFASPDGPFFPWSVVMVDNVFHLWVLYVLALPVIAT